MLIVVLNNVSSTLNIKAGYKIMSYINYLVIMTSLNQLKTNVLVHSS